MFFNADDDEQDFMSPGGSKLANLFGMDKASGQGGNESLTYTAPKQPKKKEPAPEGGAAPAVAVASVVHAYKYVDNKYASQGKLGAALLATHATKEYRILLYVNKQTQVTNAKITPTFAFNLQQNNYASFYDDARQMWSVMFESSDAAEKFAKEMAIAKANTSGGVPTELIQQDLALGEGGGLETGDSVEVKYTGWLFTNGTFGKVFDQSAADNNFRFKVGKGKVIKGWDQGMLGMKKGGKRLLVIPPSMAYGSQGVQDRIPPDSTLIFEVQVMRVKLQKGESPQESPAPTPAPAPAPAPDQDNVDDSGVKGRTKSINEHMTQPADSGKAKLISRMARMGQPMLPFQGAVPAQPDDSDEEMQHQHVEQTVPASVKPSLPAKPRSPSGSGVGGHMGHPVINPQIQPGMVQQGVTMVGNQPVIMSTGNDMFQQQQQPAFLQNLPGAQQVALYQNQNNFLQQQQQAALLQQQQQQQQMFQQQQQQHLLGQGIPGSMGGMTAPTSSFGAHIAPTHVPLSTPTTSSSSADTLAPVLLTETRQQNTEVRLSISKMSDKVDKILEKVEHMSGPGMGAGGFGMGAMTPYGGAMPAPSMEANVLMQNITRIVQENERLKKEVYEQSNKVHEQNEKIATLLEKNQKYVEQSQNLLEQRNEGYKHTASQSQAQVLSLEQEKVQLATQLSSASAQISTLQLELGEYRKKEGELKQQLQQTSSTSSSTKEELERLRLQREEDEQKITNLTSGVREEKQARKQIEAKLATHLEELADIRATNETLERNLSERKRKAAEERRKMEDDMEDAKISYEQTIESLREKLRKQKTSVDAETESKVSKLEEEISKDWQAKCDRMMAAATEKHNRQLADVKQEKEELGRKVEELEQKLLNLRSSGSSSEQQLNELQEELTEMKLWKEKYDNLRTQAATMKERYEKRIEELEGEKEEEEEKRQEIIEKAREQQQELQQQIQQLRSQQSTTGAALQQGAAVPSTDVATEVKKIMNSVFQSLRGEFDAEENYTGAEILATILNVIKQTTLKLVSQAAPKQEEESEEEEEEEDEEEEVEEEEEEEENEDAKPTQEESADQEKELEVKQDAPLAENEVTQASSQSQPVTETPAASAAEDSSEPAIPETSTDEVSIPAGISLPDVQSSTNDEEDEKEEDEDEEQENSDDRSPVTVISNTNSQAEDSKDSNKTVNAASIANGIDSFEPESKNFKDDASSDKEAPAVTETQPQAPSQNSVEEKAEEEVKIANGVDSSLPQTPESGDKGEINEQSKQAILEASTVVAPKPDSAVKEQPPPLFDEDEDEEDSPLFGNDDTVSDTLGSDFKPRTASTISSSATNTASSAAKEKTTPGKKLDLVNDEDLKPQPPPPLFGDDSDDDDLDWLS